MPRRDPLIISRQAIIAALCLLSFICLPATRGTAASFFERLRSADSYQYTPVKAQPLASLQSFTGIWDTPTARVLPDWHLRLKYGRSDPYRYYGVALGLFDRLEIHGQFTEITTIDAFPGYGYGNYKDRNAGVRFVILKESELLPQLAIGAYDPIGTSLFPSRYLVASKMMGNFDFSLGLGQGLLGGQLARDTRSHTSSKEGFDTTFLFSNPKRPTRVFGGVEYHYNPKLTLSLEYSSLPRKNFDMTHANTMGYEGTPLNVGVKYRLSKHVYMQGGYMHGREWSYGIAADLPLDPEGMLPWRREAPYSASVRLRWQAHEAGDRRLAAIIGSELQRDGFKDVTVSVRNDALWVEFANNRYLSNAKAFGRVAQITGRLAPDRIDLFFLNLARRGQVIQSLKTSRRDLQAFVDSRMDRAAYLKFADLTFYDDAHRRDFAAGGPPATYKAPEDWYDFGLDLKVKTFLNNKAGFLMHKIYLHPGLTLHPWRQARIIGEMEFTLRNEWDELDYAPREPEPTRTDIVEYERGFRPRISKLAFDEHFPLPLDTQGRFSAGIFESEYAGAGGELFRFFADGRLGLGLEGEIVRKRDPDNNFKLNSVITKNYKTAFLNLYSELVPEWGLEAGLKYGRFLAGDVGFRFELRRSFRHFTLGAWYTKTNTDVMVSDYNKDVAEKGVFIRMPLSLFSDHDKRGHLMYSFASFTRDSGQEVDQPSSLYPLDPYHSLEKTRENLEDMRRP